jgi:hypothetical protein
VATKKRLSEAQSRITVLEKQVRCCCCCCCCCWGCLLWLRWPGAMVLWCGAGEMVLKG